MPRKKADGLKVEMVSIDSVRPNPRNPRTISDQAIQAVAESISRFGWRAPLVVRRKGKVLEAGHTRLEAARRLGLEEVPVLFVSDSDADAAAFMVADNRTSEFSSWENEALAAVLEELRESEALGGTGYSDEDLEDPLDALQKNEEAEKEPPPVEPSKDPVSRRGDLWVLGPHRVLCGDSTIQEDVERLFSGARPELLVTDPPYGVRYEPKWRAEAERADGTKIGAAAVGEVANDDRADWSEAWALFPGSVAYVWHAGRVSAEVQGSLESVGFEIRSQIIWAKGRFAISRGHYHWQHEPCWYAVRKGKSARWGGDRKQSTLWTISETTSAEDRVDHATQKPVECMRRPILNHKAKTVYDPFLGSGTTLIAAEETRRACYGMELDPRYVDAIIRRWERSSGARATLEGTETNIDELAAERAKEAS